MAGQSSRSPRAGKRDKDAPCPRTLAPAFFAALPAYLGGKRRLCPLIFAILAELLPREAWATGLFLDPFSGGGAVSLFAKAQGFSVIASDVAERAVLVARALIANSCVRLRLEDVVALFPRPGDDRAQSTGGELQAGITAQQAHWFQHATAHARGQAEPLRSLLLLLVVKLFLRSFPMSMPASTDARAAAAGDFHRVSPRRLGHYLRARQLLSVDKVWRVAQEVNSGVFGGLGQAHHGQAVDIIGNTSADVLYLDPPYPGTSSYIKEYAALDRLLGDTASATAAPRLDDLLAAAQHVPVLVLSYGGPTLSLEDLTAQVARQRHIRHARAIPYAHLRAIASERKNAANRHPANPNVISEEQLEKLARNIQREERYPPLIVRSHPELPGHYQTLDGEQRGKVLEHLGHAGALCYVWECDDQTALRLLATLNRLHGEDIPVRRAELLQQLTTLLSPEELSLLLPEDAAAIRDSLKLLELDSTTLLRELEAANRQQEASAPRLLTFAVLPEDEPLVERAIAQASQDLPGSNRRGRALALVCRAYLGTSGG